MRQKIWLLALTLAGLLMACSTQEQAQLSQAAVMPLSDLNLVRKNIPQVLQKAVRQPYAFEALTCAEIDQEMQQLDEALGPDLDKPDDAQHPSLLERGVDEVKASAIHMVGRTTEGVVPFRAWVRKLSGADRHDRQVMAAITAGAVRRAFLKGFAVARACQG